MKPCMLYGLALLILSVCLAVDGSARQPPPYEKIVKDMLATVEQITDTLVGITNQGEAEAATPKLKSAAEKMLELRKQAEEKAPPKAEKDRLTRDYAPKFEAAFKKLRMETIRVKGIAGGDEALRELDILNDKKDMKDKKKGGQ